MNSFRSLICVVGAGPYGVTIAAHLKYFGIDFRILGSPMHRWLFQMPKRMFLKSEGCASSLHDPTGDYTLAQYCSKKNLPYSKYGAPISREVFADYAISFQRKLVPGVENLAVTSVSKLRDGFELKLDSGEIFRAGKVIVATGLNFMASFPEQLARLPRELCSHTADHFDLSVFKGREVIVVGAGQSALETAAILREEGASVRLLVRGSSVSWNPNPLTGDRSWYDRTRNPRTRLGDGRDLWVYDNFPGLFHYLPREIRLAKVETTLGPAGAWWLKDQVLGQVPILLNHHICEAKTLGDRVALQVKDQNGRLQELIADHVIAATGYRFDADNLPFLSQSIKNQLRREQRSPLLSSNFEFSIPGLYFTGLASANAFGPAMRFLVGLNYTGRRISSHIARDQRLRLLPLSQPERCPELLNKRAQLIA